MTPPCPIRKHDHSLVLHPDGSLRCPRDGHRWTVVPGDLLARRPWPPGVARGFKVEEWQGFVWRRHTRPHWGWPKWRWGNDNPQASQAVDHQGTGGE